MKRLILAGLAVVFSSASWVQAGEGVRTIWSFERDQTARRLPQFSFWGKPVTFRHPKVGWRGEKVGPEWKGDITAVRKSSSRDYPLMTLVARHVTAGQHAYKFAMSDGSAKIWMGRINKQSGITACPPRNDYHDIEDWYYQRCDFGYLWTSVPKNRDWSGFDRLRFDAYSEGSEVVLGVKVRDSFGKGKRPLGLRTPAYRFKVPKGKAVTCDLPLAEIARICEIDLSRIYRYHIRINGIRGGFTLYLDNVRLVKASAAKQDAKLPLVKMQGAPRPWGRKVSTEPPTRRIAAGMKRESGPVEKLGPILITDSGGQYACAPGHFGGHGATYYQSARRGCVAYDNKRLIVLMGGGPKGAKLVTKSVGEGGGVFAFGSFDGGKTWGGLTPGEKQPARLGTWYWRATLYSDRSGDVYCVGTQNCDSYHEGFDMFFRRLSFTGEGWINDKFAFVNQNGYKCPAYASAARTSKGRLWSAWRDGFGGSYAKYSDDDGYTWKPCKDAATKKTPRPFYEPKLADLKKPAGDRPKPPGEVLLWPAEMICGDFLVPYGDEVAVFSSSGSKWQVHDGSKWLKARTGPFKGKGSAITVSALGAKGAFLCRKQGEKLLASRLQGGTWKTEELDSGGIGSNILTASGENMFCFYIKKSADGYEIRYRRFKAGKWEPSVKIATEQKRLNQVAAPMFSTPDYAAIFWDQHRPGSRSSSFVKFMRIPNK
jgi:hypothetical protein